MFVMAILPASIESYLCEVGFTATEILMLRHASEGRPFTVRQLAAKAGKSTGALDQAARKLSAKGILVREYINGSPKYMLASADAITHWVQCHTDEVLCMLRRKEQDVRLYFSSMTLKQDRPHMEYFEGEEGIGKAYRQLLEFADDGILVFLPPAGTEKNGPFRELRKAYVRERRRKRIGCRVLTHDTLAGKRYQSRDVFEERRTVLVPASLYSFQCEQIVAGSTYTCFNYEKQQACLMHFSSFVASQRALFESIWSQYDGGIDVQERKDDGLVAILDSVSLAALEGDLTFT